MGNRGTFKSRNKAAAGNTGRRNALTIRQQLISVLNEPVDKRRPNGSSKLRKLIDSLVASALGGEVGAAKEIFDRIDGRPARMVALTLPNVATAADLPAAVGAVTRAVADGRLAPAEGQALANVFDAQRRAIETSELESRMRAIEERLKTDEQSD